MLLRSFSQRNALQKSEHQHNLPLKKELDNKKSCNPSFEAIKIHGINVDANTSNDIKIKDYVKRIKRVCQTLGFDNIKWKIADDKKIVLETTASKEFDKNLMKMIFFETSYVTKEAASKMKELSFKKG